MNRYEFVVRILDQAVGKPQIGAHGLFWRGKSRDEFVSHTVFGQRLIEIGDSGRSNLIKALRGDIPFGLDVPPPHPGEVFSRMPARLDPVSADRTDFIARWIDDGCPEDDVATGAVYAHNLGGPLPDAIHNTYWREFDDWAMFNKTAQVEVAINEVFGVGWLWFQNPQSTDPSPDWHASIQQPSVRAAIELLSELQIKTLAENYGNPIPAKAVFGSYELFGNNQLKDDPLRAQDQRHTMNGWEMWFFWFGFCHAAIELNIRADFWTTHLRAVLIGLINDGVFRGRFNVTGFAPAGGSQPIQNHVAQLADTDLVAEARRRLSDALA